MWLAILAAKFGILGRERERDFISLFLFSNSQSGCPKLFRFSFIQVHNEWTNIYKAKVHQFTVLLDSLDNFANFMTVVVKHKELWIGIIALAVEKDVGSFPIFFKEDCVIDSGGKRCHWLFSLSWYQDWVHHRKFRI